VYVRIYFRTMFSLIHKIVDMILGKPACNNGSIFIECYSSWDWLEKLFFHFGAG
jgi:hypothetical protein